MAPLDESWFGSGERVRKESISVRISAKAQEVLKMAGELESDGEEDYSGCCFMRGRSMSRRLSASGSDVKGGPFTRLSAEDPESAKAKPKYLRSRSVCATIFFCCGPREQSQYTTVEVRAVKQDRTWEVDVKEDYAKPPYWKQLVRKVRSQCRPRQKPEWLNYDAHSYQMNFDDGCWRETCSSASFLYADESDDSATRARAMHAALFKSRAHQDAPGSPVLSPLPVKMVSKEDIERSKEGFVPIWQRRQGAPPIKLDLRQRSGPMED
jgi:hypothetical protein